MDSARKSRVFVTVTRECSDVPFRLCVYPVGALRGSKKQLAFSWIFGVPLEVFRRQ